MKKSTQKLMALAIILIFALSSLAFAFIGYGSQPNNQPNPTQLTSFIIDGEINPTLENTYIQNGYTFLKFYHTPSVGADVTNLITQAPVNFMTPSGQTQIIVLKINSTSTYVQIINLNGQKEITNITNNELFSALCSTLIATPTECAIANLT